MDITKLLKKTKDRADKIQPLAKRELNIATGYRPYHDNFVDKEKKLTNKTKKETTETPINTHVEEPLKEDMKESIKESTQASKKESIKESIREPLSSQKAVKKESLREQKAVIEESLSSQKEVKKESLREQKGVFRESLSSQKEVKKESLGSPIEPKNIHSNINEPLIDRVQKLTGHQKKMFFFIIDICCNRGSLETGPITTEDLAKLCDTTVKTIKTQIKRLLQKEVMQRGNGKKARGGYLSFQITEDAKNIVLSLNKLGTKEVIKGSIQESSSSVVSSSINNTNTYLGESLPETWDNIDIEPLKEMGFSRSHLLQLFQDYKKNPELSLSPETINHSIISFAYDYTHNKNAMQIRTTPIGKLMGCLKQARPYTSLTPDKVKSPQQVALEKYKEAKEAEMRKKEELVEEIKAIERKAWFNKLSEEDIKSIGARTNARLKKDSIDENKFEIKMHFAKEIWPEIETRLRKEHVIID
jgi:hypothetical protein